MECRSCNREMEEFWCDDGINTAGMLYECKCGKRYIETGKDDELREI